MLKLYDYFRSTACYRVRIALNIKELDYDLETIHLIHHGGEQHSANYKAINPQALVPALKEDEQVLTQSLAIIEYLDEVYPSPPILPKKPHEKALVRAFALSIAADIHPLNNLRVLNYLKNELTITDEEKQKWYHHWMLLGLTALESALANHEKRAFCFTDYPTLADICLVPQLYNAKRFHCDLTPYPNLVRIDQHCATLKAFADAYPQESYA